MTSGDLYRLASNGEFPSEDECKAWMLSPLLQQERSLFSSATDNITDTLLRHVETNKPQKAALALQCLQPLSLQSSVQVRLQKRWESADGFLRGHLLWRISDDPDLTPAFKCQMFLWALHDWREWTNCVYSFNSSDPGEIVRPIRNRLDEPGKYPEHKKWIMLLCLPIASDPQEAWHLIESTTLGDPFAQHVRRIIMELRDAGRLFA